MNDEIKLIMKRGMELPMSRESAQAIKAVEAYIDLLQTIIGQREAELRTVKAERERMREALEKLNGFSRRDLGETDLHAYVNETCQEALTATPAKEEGDKA